MTMDRLTIVSVVVALAVLGLVFELLRRRRLREKYAVIWFLIALATVTVAVFPDLLTLAARLVGVQTPSNLLFFASLLTLLAVALQLSGEIGVLEEQTRRLAEEIGVLQMRVEEMQQDDDPGERTET